MAGATHLVAATNNVNPSTTVSGTTGAATAAGDKVIVSLYIPNSNPTALTVTFDGQAMTEMSSARSTRSNKTILTFYYDDAAGRASGKTVSASWTNTGTQNGGGSCLLCSKATPTNAFVSGAAEKINVGNGLSQAPTTNASGTPSDTTADYFAYATMGAIFNVAGGETPDNAYTAMTQAALTGRNLLLDAAWKEFTSPPVATQTETWTVTWGANKDWVAAIMLFKESVPSAPTIITAPVESGTETVGSTLSTTDGTWNGSPTSFSYQWQRDVGTAGVTWLDIAGATANTYVLVADDIGSKIRCRVVATNANGNSDPAASNATSVTIPAPSGVISWRIVGGPIAQSDNQTHTMPLDKPVLAGETLVIFAACSNANLTDGNGNRSDVGSFTDADSNTYVQDSEAFSDTNIQHSCQAFSTVASVKMDYQDNITMHVHGGSGAGAYHGQSPFWIAIAINAGSSSTMTFDQQAHQVDLLTTHVAPNITSAASAIVFGFHAGEPGTGAGWWTPGAGFTEVADTPQANSGAPNYTGESAYNISAEVKVVTSAYTGGAGGTTGSNKTITNLVVSYTPVGGTTPVSQTAVAPIEATKALAATDAAVWDAKQALAVVASASPWEAKVSLARVAAAAPWESSASPQIIRPSSDISAGGWTPSTGVNLWAMIDEVTPDTADYDQSSPSPVTPDVMEVKLQAAGDPGTTGDGSQHHVRYQIYKSAASADNLDITVRLMMGATQIASWTHTNVGTTPTSFDQTLSNAQADAILNYGDLRLRFEAVKE